MYIKSTVASPGVDEVIEQSQWFKINIVQDFWNILTFQGVYSFNIHIIARSLKLI
jgi:hypothetical protein